MSAAFVAAPGKRLSPEQEEKAREAMRQERARLDASEQATAEAAGRQKAAPALAVKPEPVAVAITTGQTEKQMKDAAALEKKRNKEAAMAAARQQKDQEAQAAAIKKVSAKSGSPMPADLVPGSKEQRLYDLLQQYKADKLTPSEYHMQRAKILSE